METARLFDSYFEKNTMKQSLEDSFFLPSNPQASPSKWGEVLCWVKFEVSKQSDDAFFIVFLGEVIGSTNATGNQHLQQNRIWKHLELIHTIWFVFEFTSFQIGRRMFFPVTLLPSSSQHLWIANELIILDVSVMLYLWWRWMIVKYC